MASFNFFGGCSEMDMLLDDLARVEHVADMTMRFSVGNLMESAMFTASSLAFLQFLTQSLTRWAIMASLVPRIFPAASQAMCDFVPDMIFNSYKRLYLSMLETLLGQIFSRL